MNPTQPSGSLDHLGERDHEATQEYQIFGPPGTGKTTSLSRQIERAARKHGSGSVLVTSFSRTAATELVGRKLPIPRNMVGTLHSHCFRALDAPDLAETHVDDWNKQYPMWRILPSKVRASKEGDVEENEFASANGARKGDGDTLLEKAGRWRNRMTPPSHWPDPKIAAFHEKWCEWKDECGLLDFTDLIEIANQDIFTAPGDPRVIFVDEAQDLTKLQLSLIRKWGNAADWFVCCGDDDQCQPEGTMVKTTEGQVPIEDLTPGHHQLFSHAVHEGRIYGKQHGFDFRKAQRYYDGRLLKFVTDDNQTECTPDHKLNVRWVKGSALDKAHVVYLMRKGRRFRIGWCKLMRADGALHFGVRCNLEQADAAWILHVTDSAAKASIYESYVAAKFGLPLVMFQAKAATPIYSQQSIEWLFGKLDDCLPARAKACLEAHNLNPRFPFWKPNRVHRGGSKTFKIEAVNMIPHLMSLPVAREGDVSWQSVRVSSRRYCGQVYSLEVRKHHTYIADGIAVRNCIYNFTGAQPDALLDPNLPQDHKIILSQSYRVPAAVHRVATEWIERVSRREPKVYRPRDCEGCVRTLEEGSFQHPDKVIADANLRIESGKSVMMLASCGYMLQSLLTALRARGIAYGNEYARERAFLNPLTPPSGNSMSQRILALLSAHPVMGDKAKPWRGRDVKLWIPLLNSKGILRRGVKKLVADMIDDEEITIRHLDEWFEREPLERMLATFDLSYHDLLEWFSGSILEAKEQAAEFPLRVADRNIQWLRKPQITVGTIHSVKGGQADVVYVFPDLSMAGESEWSSINPEKRDAVIRLFYVAMTRAREELVFVPSATTRHVPIGGLN